MAQEMFLPTRFRTYVQLAPYELNKDIEERLLQTLRKNLEGTCSRFGYIMPGSLQIVKRSAGIFMKQHFNGHIRFELVCKARVCNPAQGAVYRAVVRQKNALGIQAESMLYEEDEDGAGDANVPVLDIIIPRKSAGIHSDIDLDLVEVGSTLHVQVLGKRFQLHDSKISIVGRAVEPGSVLATAEDAEEADFGEEEPDPEAASEEAEVLDEGGSEGEDDAEAEGEGEGERAQEPTIEGGSDTESDSGGSEDDGTTDGGSDDTDEEEDDDEEEGGADEGGDEE